MKDLRKVAGSHREAAIFVYQQHGRVHPKLFVESETQIVLIEPSSWEACDVSDWQRAELLYACMRSVDAVIIGRCDEVYIREATMKRDRMMNDDLASMVDFDPSIRSALMVHSFDLRNNETYMTMATFDLDNEGLPFWERHEMISAYDVIAVPLWAAAKMIRRTPDYPLSAFEADEFVNERNWVTTRLDK